MKIFLLAVVVLIIATLSWFFFGGVATPAGNMPGTPSENAETSPEAQRVRSGSYEVDVERSAVNWAGKKPLIQGYINSGTFGIKDGTIAVGADSATGSLTLDMTTLKVGLTASKPGQEGKLEEHLKGDRFFDVTQYPTATFAITSVAPTATSETDFTYTLTGDLTMKGQTHEVVFPSVIYEIDGTLFAKATTEIDRTKWGITAGSGNFFENLGDNVIDDMVGLSIHLEAQKVE